MVLRSIKLRRKIRPRGGGGNFGGEGNFSYDRQ